MLEARWINDGGRLIIAYKYKCSACYKRSAEQSNYCPNCGARMRKANEDIRNEDLPDMREGVRSDARERDSVLKGVSKKEE